MGLLQDRGSHRSKNFVELFSGALQENPVIVRGNYIKNVYRIILVIMSPQRVRPPFVSQYFWENPGGCGHRIFPQ